MKMEMQQNISQTKFIFEVEQRTRKCKWVLFQGNNTLNP